MEQLLASTSRRAGERDRLAHRFDRVERSPIATGGAPESAEHLGES